MSISNKLEKKIINNGNDRFIQLTLDNEKILEFEIGFLNSVSEEGLIEVEKTIFDNKINLKYCITGLITFEQYFETRENTKENMIEVFSSVSEIISKCNFLTSNKFIIESDMIFINPENLKVKLIYLPIESEYTTDISNDFKNMASDIISGILNNGNIKEGSADFLIGLKKKIQEENLTIADLVKEAKKQYKMNNINIDNNNQKSRESSNNIEKSTFAQGEYYSLKQKELNQKQKNTVNNTNEKQSTTTNNSDKVNKNIKEKNVQIEETKVEEISRYKISRILGAIIIQPIFIGLILALFLIKGLDLIKIIGALVLFLCLDGIILKNLLDPSKKERVKVEVSSLPERDNKKDSKKENKKKVNKKKEEDRISPKPIKKQEEVIFDEETSIIEVDDNFDEETTIISSQAYLEVGNGIRDGREDITSDKYIIGRNAGLRNWISGSGVSREHAVIVNYGGNYIIKDLNSKNGTKINGSKLVRDQEISLSDGDVIEIPGLVIKFRI